MLRVAAAFLLAAAAPAAALPADGARRDSTLKPWIPDPNTGLPLDPQPNGQPPVLDPQAPAGQQPAGQQPAGTNQSATGVPSVPEGFTPTATCQKECHTYDGDWTEKCTWNNSDGNGFHCEGCEQCTAAAAAPVADNSTNATAT